jgi:Hyaluronidase
MFYHSDMVLPSVYLTEKLTSKERQRSASLMRRKKLLTRQARLIARFLIPTARKFGLIFYATQVALNNSFLSFHSMVKGRIREAMRASKSYSDKPKPVFVYIRYVYADTRKLVSEVRTKLLIARPHRLARSASSSSPFSHPFNSSHHVTWKGTSRRG